MKVILKQDVKGVGRKYDVKNVADGYANNFLLPRKLAEYASPETVKKSQVKKLQEEAEMEIREELTKKQIEMLQSVKIVLQKKASDKGHLFEKIHEAEIAEALKNQAHIDIPAEFIKIEKPIKEIGEHIAVAEIGKNKGEFKVVVEA
jgi:large subunit ribosomal protein L9